MTVLAIVVAGALIAGAVLFVHYEPIIRSRRRKKVIVTCKSGAAWRGVLAESDRQMIVLRNTDRLTGADTVAVDGEVLLHRSDVEFMQRF